VSFPQPEEGDKVRGKPEKFAEHYAQATLFYDSQTDVEKAHLAGGFRWELSKVAVPAIRERMISSLVNVSPELAAEVAAGLGMEVPAAMPKAISDPEPPEVTVSPALSLMALPGERGIRTRQIAVLIENGVHHASLLALHGALMDACAVVQFVGPRVGMFESDSGEKIEANKSMENSPSVLFDALVLPDGIEAVEALAANGHTMEFVKDQFRHSNDSRVGRRAGVVGDSDWTRVSCWTPTRRDRGAFIDSQRIAIHGRRTCDPADVAFSRGYALEDTAGRRAGSVGLMPPGFCHIRRLWSPDADRAVSDLERAIAFYRDIAFLFQAPPGFFNCGGVRLMRMRRKASIDHLLHPDLQAALHCPIAGSFRGGSSPHRQVDHEL
jgi:hypothetical protein